MPNLRFIGDQIFENTWALSPEFDLFLFPVCHITMGFVFLFSLGDYGRQNYEYVTNTTCLLNLREKID